MSNQQSGDFVAGVIEGFYGPPWSPGERVQLFDWMAAWGLNTYFYAPKDDLKHRAVWRELYSETEAAQLRDVIRTCEARNIQFLYALSPGLDVRYSEAAELEKLQARFEQMIILGCSQFALLFDDIPDRMDPGDLARWGSLASAQSAIANAVLRWLRAQRPNARLFFCPTPYCSRMAAAELGGRNYLAIIGRELHEDIDVFWTGPEIISHEITVDHVKQIGGVLRRKPVIWDNLHANDYDGRRFYCGPYAGRPQELRAYVGGLLANPNCEFPLNFVPLHTLGSFVHGREPWDPYQAWLKAMSEWWPSFAGVGSSIELEDLILFGECYYLPYEEGPQARALLDLARRLLTSDPSYWNAEEVAEFRRLNGRLRNLCVQLTGLQRRSLFNALARRVWDLREELDLLDKYVEFKARLDGRDRPFSSDFHLPGTYRGGAGAQLQALLRQNADGTFSPNSGLPRPASGG